MKYEVMQGSEINYLNIRSDKKSRQFKYRNEVPAKVIAGEFDWTDAEDNFFKYKGSWFHTEIFLIAPGVFQKLGFDGVYSYTASSGIAIKILDKGEKYRIAYFWYSRS